MTGRLDFGFTFGASGAQPLGAVSSQGPFRIVLLGDFSGHGLRGLAHPTPLAQRRAHRVDIDNLEAVFQRLAPALTLPLQGAATEGLALTFTSIDDFHPDALAGRLPEPVASVPAAEPAPAPVAGEDHAQTLERLLGRKPPASANPTGLDALIHSIVKPSLLPEVPAGQAQAQAATQAARAGVLRQVLHHPHFQALEADWRGVLQLVRGLDLDGELRLHLLDVASAELLADPAAAEASLAQTLTREAQADEDGGDAPAWPLIVGLKRFGPAEADLALLSALGRLARRLGGAFMGSANPAVVGLSSVANQADIDQWPGMAADDQARWDAFRRGDAAEHVHLAWPRLLMRLPYGRDTDPVADGSFEEMAPGFVHDQALWGQGALAPALLIGQTFMAEGWGLRVGALNEVDDLPAYVLTRDGERTLLPCAEANLGERAGAHLLALGLMPLLSHKQRNAVHVMSFQAMG